MKGYLTKEQIEELKESASKIAIAMSEVGITKFSMDLLERKVDMEVASDIPIEESRLLKFHNDVIKMCE